MANQKRKTNVISVVEDGPINFTTNCITMKSLSETLRDWLFTGRNEYNLWITNKYINGNL